MAGIVSQIDRRKTVKTPVRHGEHVIVGFVPWGGYKVGATPTRAHVIHPFGALTAMSDPGISAGTAEDIQTVFHKLTTVETGNRIDDFTLEFLGGSLIPMWVIFGRDITLDAAITFESGSYKKDNVGYLMVYQFDMNDEGRETIVRTDVIFNVSARVTMLPGATAGGTTPYSITLFSDSADVMSAPYPFVLNTELFYADGFDVIDPAAPNGLNTAYTLGTSAHAFASAPTIAAKRIDATGTTDLDKYMRAFVLPAGSTVPYRVNNAQATFDGVNEITWTATSLAQGDALHVVYATVGEDLAADGYFAHFRADATDEDGTPSIMRTWEFALQNPNP